MPLMRESDLLKEAHKNGYGIPAFNVFNFESIAWLIETAEEENTPVIVMLYPGWSFHIPISTCAAITKDMASKVSAPIALHLDHSGSFSEIMSAVSDGFPSVMIDGSALEFEKNVAATKEVVKAAHAMNVDVEAELGHVGSAGNASDYEDTSHYTSPESAEEFVRRTEVDSLAVAIGSAHGDYISTPKLDIGRLKEIDKVAGVPLVLHGGSGIPDEQIKEAVQNGICKINIGTEYNRTVHNAILRASEDSEKVTNALTCMSAAKDEVKEYIRKKIHLLRP